MLTALRREIAEETALKVRDPHLVGLYSDPAYQVVTYPDGANVHFVTAVFACHRASGTLRGNGEGTDWRWFQASALPSRLLPYAVVWLRDAITENAGMTVR